MASNEFVLWLEFEATDPAEEWDADNEFFNMHIKHADKCYALNVWSFGFMRKLLDEPETARAGWLAVPDLFVATCTRAHMEQVFDSVIDEDGLKQEWLMDHDFTALDEYD